MKKILLFTLLSVFISSLSQSQNTCLPHGYNFNNQTEIDSFQIKYPDCTNILGSIMITDLYTGEITNLNSFNKIKTIGGQLVIGDNSILSTLEGLNNITSVNGNIEITENESLKYITLDSLKYIGGDFDINSNALLSDISPLSKLKIIDGKLHMFGCPNITSVGAFNSVESIGGDIVIASLDSLENLNGLNNIGTIGGSLRIGFNTNLKNIDGLVNVSSIDGMIFIWENDSLQSISGLLNTTSIGGSLVINNNNSLLSLEGLDNIEPHTIESVSIQLNTSLSECNVNSICDYLSNQYGDISINFNKQGCYSNEEVLTECGVGIHEENIELVKIYPNPANYFIIIDTPETIKSVILRDITGKEISELSTSCDNYQLPKTQSGFYLVDIKTKSQSIIRKIAVLQQ